MLRRSELVALQVVDVTIERGGSASLLVRRAKTDPEGGGAMLYLHRDSVRLLSEWLSASGISGGPLFRSMRKDGTLGGRLHESQVPRIYKAMAERAGLPEQVVRRLSGHSPRVGAAQDMIASGIGIPAIMQAGRWKSAQMVQALRRAAAGPSATAPPSWHGFKNADEPRRTRGALWSQSLPRVTLDNYNYRELSGKLSAIL